jgi:hypothetical protein
MATQDESVRAWQARGKWQHNSDASMATQQGCVECHWCVSGVSLTGAAERGITLLTHDSSVSHPSPMRLSCVTKMGQLTELCWC